MDSYAFPPEFVNPKDKEDPKYGVQYAKAAYYSDNRMGAHILSSDTEYQSLIELAAGRQSVSNIRKLFGFHRAATPNSDGPESLAYIDPQVLNLAPKYVNRAVAKMQRRNYDVSLEAIDLLSVNEKADYQAIVRAFYRFKDFSTTMGVPLQAVFEDIDISTMPEHPDEMLYDINTNPKLKKEIEGELGLQLIMAMNNFKQKLRQADWDVVVVGHGHLHTYLDQNGFPRVEHINAKYWGGSYVDNDDFEEQEYAYFLDCITVNQFIREASPFYNQAELQELVRQHAIRNSNFQPASNRVQAQFDNLNYIPVMRFYFKSEDNRNYIKKKNQFGSLTFMDRSFDYKPSDITKERLEKDTKLIRNTYTTIYGGTWIIDSNVCYNYGSKKTPRTNLVEASLPIKTVGTNYKEGRWVSFTSQMIEPLYMINVAWNKVKAILAKEWMGIREIDFNQIENIALGKGGNQWKAREVFEFMEMSNTLVKRGVTNQYGQSNGMALSFQNSGVALTDYFNTIRTSINILEQMTGTTLIESADTPDRLGKSVMQESQQTGDLDMEYLYNAHEYLYERTSHQLLLLMQEAKRDKAKIKGFIPALGKIHTGYYEVPDEIAYCDYGMILKRQPTQQEWADFYMDVQIALKNGTIGSADSAFVREIDNLKMARQVLGNREAMYKRQLIKEKQMDIQANQESNAQSIMMKEQADARKIQLEKDAKAELIALQGKIDLALQNEKSQQEASIRGFEAQMKQQIEKQHGIDEIMKQGVKNIPEQKKADASMIAATKPVPAKTSGK